jgi:prevent-host-death family protein
MMITNIYDAKAKLSSLVNLALAGQDIVIAKAGTPTVRLVPIKKMTLMRKPGFWKGKVKIGKDFEMLPKRLMVAFGSR